MALRDRLRVMVVDDMAASRGLITQALDHIGIFNYDYVKDGPSALTALQTKPIDLVISDYEMPGMSGLELLAGLRKAPKTKRVGFVLVSGRATADIINRGKTLGMNNFIQKPIDGEKLRGCLEAVVGKL